jgi:hypothetical protein
MKIKFEWEDIIRTSHTASSTHRSKVIGGWLVRTMFNDEDGNSVALQFISDPEHKWEIESD